MVQETLFEYERKLVPRHQRPALIVADKLIIFRGNKIPLGGFLTNHDPLMGKSFLSEDPSWHLVKRHSNYPYLARRSTSMVGQETEHTTSR